jgi:hypothetical protein
MFLRALLTVACFVTVADAQQPRFNEHEVKAVFLFNFVQFVDWPANAFGDVQAPVVIGILGDDPFGRTLDDVIQGEHVRNRELVIQRYGRLEDVAACHILFVSPSESERYERIVASLKDRPTLTVGDTAGFASRGGMVRFLTERNRIRFEVNVAAVKAAGLTISSTLLRSASIVGGPR